MSQIPRLQLTHGQVAWSLCGGQPPDKRTLDALRYLRQLGVPFTKDELGVGRGNRLTYTFDHLVECAVAMYAIRRATKPSQAAQFLVLERNALRKMYREAFHECPEGALDAEWIKSRGHIVPTVSDERFIRVHDRYAETSGKIELMTMDEVMTFKAGIGDLVERHSNDIYALVPLKRVMLEAVALSRIAPVTPPGRPAARLTAQT